MLILLVLIITFLCPPLGIFVILMWIALAVIGKVAGLFYRQ